MASFFITGKLGTGKSLVAVAKMVEYLAKGNLVCTNLDLFPDRYFSPSSKKTVMRIPDKPSIEDFENIGIANDTYNEEKNGLLVLDELGSWFNARDWQDKERKKLLTWFLYLRKRGWDVLLLVQDISMVDGQLRSILAEHLVCCRRLDRLPIPFVGKLLKFVGLKGNLPRMHRARVYLGENEQALHIDTWSYFGTEFYNLYDTKQIFSPDYSHGVHSVLSAWHTKGRYLPQAVPLSERFKQGYTDFINARADSPIPLKPKSPLLARIAALPCPEQRLEFFRRFEACGAFDRCAA
ncbi:MAG: zonular occludens toxin domain-containing protein [Gallionella sp.]|jgi:hypothetical protein